MNDFHTWSCERVETLARLWAEGLTAAQIARRLGGVSRNAVIGKARRLGLGDRRPRATAANAGLVAPGPIKPRRTAVARRGPVASSPATTVVARHETSVLLVESGVVDNLMSLDRHACRWPIGDPRTEAFAFCGRWAQDRYCDAHRARSVRPGKVWRPERDAILRLALAGRV